MVTEAPSPGNSLHRLRALKAVRRPAHTPQAQEEGAHGSREGLVGSSSGAFAWRRVGSAPEPSIGGGVRRFLRLASAGAIGNGRGPSLFERRVPGKVLAARDRIDVDKPISSLDQLYFQAAGMDAILRRKVQEWAAASNGWFFLSPDHDDAEGRAGALVLWEEVRGDPAVRARIKWGKIKAPDRAVEKLLRSYGQDTSRLLDVCRQSIMFRSLGDMTQCLGAVAADEEVTVVRVKNKMRLDHGEADSAGYRDVAFNVRICSEETLQLGLDGHVCEVILLMSAFAELKHDQGHARYISYRNERAE